MKIKRMAILYILLIVIGMAGCGEVREVPQLMEPLADNRSFRPVSKRTIGKPDVEIGHVVPKEYPHYYEKKTPVNRIYCNPGDYVNQGDVLVEADVEALLAQLEDLVCEYELLVNKHQVSAPIYDYKLWILKQKRKVCLDENDEKGAGEYLTEIEKEEENHTYDEQLYAYMEEFYQKEIANVRKNIQDSTMKASHSGYVTYVKDTSKDNTADINEAIVVIGDYEDTYIEIPQVYIDKNPYKKYEYKYAFIDGKEIPIEEYEYTGQESALARARGNSPNVRYRTVDEKKLTVGDTLILGFMMSEKRDVLAAGLDSTNVDEDGNYVYVKGEDGALEKRYVKLGTGDQHYVEVLDGLTEGEEVYYIQESVKPVNYEEYTVETGHIVQGYEGKGIKNAETQNTAYLSPVNGKIERIEVTAGQEVKKGDTLMVIDTGGGRADIQQLENDISHLNLEYEKNIRDYEKAIKDYKEDAEKVYGVYRSDLEIRIKLTEIEKEICRLEYEESLRKLINKLDKVKKNNNGSGKVSIVAREDGIVSRIYVKEGSITEVGKENNLLLSCAKVSDRLIQISIGKDAAKPGLGRRIVVTDERNREYEATVIEYAVNGKAYAFTNDGKACVSVVSRETASSPYVIARIEEQGPMGSIDLKNSSAYIEEFDAGKLIVIPGTALFYE